MKTHAIMPTTKLFMLDDRLALCTLAYGPCHAFRLRGCSCQPPISKREDPADRRIPISVGSIGASEAVEHVLCWSADLGRRLGNGAAVATDWYTMVPFPFKGSALVVLWLTYWEIVWDVRLILPDLLAESCANSVGDDRKARLACKIEVQQPTCK